MCRPGTRLAPCSGAHQSRTTSTDAAGPSGQPPLVSLRLRAASAALRHRDTIHSHPDCRAVLIQIVALHTLLAALNVLEGKVIGRCMQRHRHQEFIRFLNAVERQVPAGKSVHAIMDNYATHKHPKVVEWLSRHPRWTFHFTPTSASWINAVEGFFAILTKRRLKRGVFKGVVDLQAAINRFLAEHNQHPRPFVWTANPDKIIAAASRGHPAWIQSTRRDSGQRVGKRLSSQNSGLAQLGASGAGSPAGARPAGGGQRKVLDFGQMKSNRLRAISARFPPFSKRLQVGWHLQVVATRLELQRSANALRARG